MHHINKFFYYIFKKTAALSSTPTPTQTKLKSPPPNSGGLIISDLNVWMSNFCICIIDDCMGIDIPLIDIQFSRFSLLNSSRSINSDKSSSSTINKSNSGLFGVGSQGSAEFALNIDYYNRLLSGWEPLVEPWLARLNWKLKTDKNICTVTSMDVLNVNLTNPFLELITGVLSNWKKDFTAEEASSSKKRHNSFQPYKLVNLTGQSVKFSILQNTNPTATASATSLGSSCSFASLSEFVASSLKSLDPSVADWTQVDDKCDKQFNFFQTNPNNTATAVTSSSSSMTASKQTSRFCCLLLQMNLRKKR